MKNKLLNVDWDILNTHGAVSQQTVEAMVTGAIECTGATYAIATSGIAGPGGGSEEKPVGTVWIGLATDKELEAFHFSLPWKRDFVRRFSCHQALDILRRSVSNLQLPDSV